MNTLIREAITRYKITLCLFFLIAIIGTIQYQAIPKESEPDIPIPFVMVSVNLDGISPDDAISQLLKPLEQEINQIDDVVSYEGEAYEGGAKIKIEFDTTVDLDIAFSDVKDAVDKAKSDLPSEADEPIVKQISMATSRAIITVMVSGTSPESTRLKLARELQDSLESIPEVLEVNLIGDKEESLEINVTPDVLNTYGIDPFSLASTVSNNNALVPAGTLDIGSSIYTFQVPGSLKTSQDILNLPLIKTDNGLIKLNDLADINLKYKDEANSARLNGESTFALKVMKKPGENLINATDNVKEIVEKYREILKGNTHLIITDDSSDKIKTMLSDLENNVIASIILVIVFVMFLLGYRSSFLVGLSIPGSFLIVFTVMGAQGSTMNMMVLFGLIMSVGMLVDGAIVVVEYASKLQEKGIERKEAFIKASQRMAWPIISSTATTLAAFMPLLFWPGTTGEFMKYLPLTLIISLLASLVMALLVIPMFGAKIAKKKVNQSQRNVIMEPIENGYRALINKAVDNKAATIFSIILISFAIVKGFNNANNGVVFFPATEAEGLTVSIKLPGNISLSEKSKYVKEVENAFQGFDEVESSFATIGGDGEEIGSVRISLIDWDKRKRSAQLIPEFQAELDKIKGLHIEIAADRGGPGGGKELVLELSSDDMSSLYKAATEIYYNISELDYLKDLEDSRPLSGLQWDIVVNREKAALYGANVVSIGNTIGLITKGIKVSDYQPVDSDDSRDIIVRFPAEYRNIDTLKQLQIKTDNGMVPISYMVDINQSAKVSTVERLDGKITVKLQANLKDNYILSKQLPEIQSIIKSTLDNYSGITPKFGGDQEKQKESSAFLVNALGIALAIMFIILLAQFNQVYQALIVLTAVALSTVGVMGLLTILGQPFGVIMGGIGIISLAGIIVNNSIILIDAFNEKIAEGMNKQDAAKETGADRLRPVLLTTITTGIGLVPMAIALNLDFVTGEFYFNAPSSMFWTQLSQTIIGGLMFSTIITLILTPCLLSINGPTKKSFSLFLYPVKEAKKIASRLNVLS